ncbi:MAG: PASTA domain-containing protein [Sedimentisphaerales bacterium]|nr:PASTA domain-containing protein [Sedimentisphaerales bacterium]
MIWLLVIAAGLTAGRCQVTSAGDVVYLTMWDTPGGSSYPPPGTYEWYDGHDVTVQLLAFPDECYRFDYWGVDDTEHGHIHDPSSPSTRITVENGWWVDVWPVFTKITYKVTICDPTGGQVSPGPGDHTYECGSACPIPVQATPNSCYRFTGWKTTGGVAVIDYASASTNMCATADGTLCPEFEKITYTVTVYAPTDGTVWPSPGSHSYDCGSVVSISAAPPANYKFKQWNSSGGVTVTNAAAASTSMTVTGDGTLRAVFEIIISGVPNVVGMMQEDAEEALTAAGFEVGEIWWGPSDRPEGTIYGQDPAAGAQKPHGSPVTLMVSQEDAAPPPGPGPGPGPGGSTVPLLVDGDFDVSSDSTALRANSGSQDWYESREDVPTLVTLDTANVGGNATKKVKLTGSATGSACLTQEFSTPQAQQFAAQWDIYVDSILDRPGSSYDRAAWVFIGDDTGTTAGRTGPNAEDSERFVYLGFYKAGGGSSGTMELVAREGSTSATTFTTVATGLSLKKWYTITVVCDMTQDNYDVYVDGKLKKTVKARTPKSSVTHISFAEWAQSEGAATFYVDNVVAEADLVADCGLFLVDSDFDASPDSAALLANSKDQDWYESRQDGPTLLTLDSTDVGGNATKKAKLTAATAGNAYLTQEFSAPQTQRFMAQWDIYVDSILDRPASNYDRAAWVFIGDDTGATPGRIGPNAEDSERFVYLGFYKAGGGSSGTMDLMVREESTTVTTFRIVATDLSLKKWYTIGVVCDLTKSTYDVYVDGQFQRTVKARTPKSSLTHISFAQWPQSEGAATFYVDNVTAECVQ